MVTLTLACKKRMRTVFMMETLKNEIVKTYGKMAHPFGCLI